MRKHIVFALVILVLACLPATAFGEEAPLATDNLEQAAQTQASEETVAPVVGVSEVSQADGKVGSASAVEAPQAEGISQAEGAKQVEGTPQTEEASQAEEKTNATHNEGTPQASKQAEASSASDPSKEAAQAQTEKASLASGGSASANPDQAAQPQVSEQDYASFVSDFCEEAAQAQTSDQMVAHIDDAFEALRAQEKGDPTRVKEMTTTDLSAGEVIDEDELDDASGIDFSLPAGSITIGDKTMRYLVKEKGEQGESGYPLYIVLHGGGTSTPAENDGQWYAIFDAYESSIDDGIFVACRGMEDAWNMHSLPDAYAMYDRLIADMVLLKNVDPNRVYLLGFSAGGDGVYEVTPRMADRFAAANMSSGHPNSVSLLNVANVPFEIQVGIRDYYDDTAIRSVKGAAFESTLNDYRNTYGFGYEHRVLVHVPEGHNYKDYAVDMDPNSLVLTDPATFATRALKENWLAAFVDIYDRYFPNKDKAPTDSSGAEYTDPDIIAAVKFLLSISKMSYLIESDATDGLKGEALEAAKRNFAAYNAAMIQKITGTGEGEYGMQTATVDTDAVHYVNRFTRTYCPSQVVWDLTTRAAKRDVSSFYWLNADQSVNKGLIVASFDAATNTFVLKPSDDLAGDFSVLINPRMVDVSRPVTFETPKGIFTLAVEADPTTLETSLRTVNDPFLAWVQEISYAQLTAPEKQDGAADKPATAGGERMASNVAESVTQPVASAPSTASKLPKTGDRDLAPLALAAALSFAAVVALLIRRKVSIR